MYGFSIRSLDGNQTVIYQQSLNSAQEVEAVKQQLIAADEQIERKSFVFPHVEQAMKTDTIFWMIIESIKGFFIDVVSLPFRLHTYGEYKQELKQTVPIYQYLQNHRVPQKYLDQDQFEVIFYSGELGAEAFWRRSNVLMLINPNPEVLRGRNYQEFGTYRVDAVDGYSQKGGGLTLLTDDMIQRLRQNLVAT